MAAKPVNDTLLSSLVKIDQDITTENDIKIRFYKPIVGIHKIDSFELNLLTELRLYTNQLWVGPASHKIAPFQIQWNWLNFIDIVNSLMSGLDHTYGNITGEQAVRNVWVLFSVFLHRHDGGIRLFPG